MKNILALLIVLPLMTSCKKVKEYTQFQMDYKETVVVKSSTIVDLPFNINTPPMQTGSESTFASNNTRKHLIKKIILTKMQLKVISPPDGNFGFLKSVEVYLSADGLAEKRIAYKEDIPDDIGDFLNLTTTSENLREYIKKDAYTLRVKVVTDETIATDHEIEVYSQFFVDAELF